MIIHVVKPGESIYSIGRRYNIPPASIIADNELTNAGRLAVGQTLVILEDTKRHVVSPGQSLYTIAGIYGVGIDDLRLANPQVSGGAVYPGMVINIPPRKKKLGTIEVNGYALPSIKMDVLRKTLPYLTYLSIFSHEVNPDGTLRPVNDAPLISAARAQGVAPLLVITDIQQGGSFSGEVAHAILANSSVQDTLLTNAINTMRSKNYYGLDVDFEYINPEDRENYNNFLRKAAKRLSAAGYTLTTALAPKDEPNKKGILYEAHDYPVHGALTTHVILMTYEWGFTYGPAMAVAPIDLVKKVLDYAVTAIPRHKIFMGIPNYGYDWTLPFVQGSAAKTLTNPGAVELASRVGAAIQYDEKSQAPHYNYYDKDKKQHEVWFEDARSIRAKLETASQYGLGGVSYWTIGSYFPQNWLVLRSLFNIRKVI